MIAVLIGDVTDYQFAVEKYGSENVKYLSHARYVTQLLKDNSLEDFYCSEYYPSDKAIQEIIKNWYRNENGIDRSVNLHISIGQTLSHKLAVDIVTLAREYFSMKYWSINYEKVIISVNENDLFSKIASLFGNVDYYDFGNDIECLKKYNPTASPQYSNIWDSKLIKPTIARLIQRVLFGRLSNKKLLLADWTYERIVKKESDSLIQNSRSIVKGFYLSFFSGKYLNESNNVFPENGVDFILNNEAFTSYLSGLTGIESEFIKLIETHLRDIYAENRSIFCEIYSSFYELYEYYKPTTITFPGESHPIYLVAIQLAYYLNIKTSVMYDGYIIEPVTPILTTKDGDPLVGKYIAFGNAGYDCFNAGGIAKSHISDPIFPPLLTLCKPEHDSLGDEIIVLSYVADDSSLNGRRDYRFQIAIDIVSFLLSDNSENKISIKIKSEDEKNMMEDILKINGMSNNVKVESGKFSDVLPKAKLVIGSISSAMAESLYYQVPYYLYEPTENGVTAMKTINNPAIHSSAVAYTIDELSKNLMLNNIPFKEESYYFER